MTPNSPKMDYAARPKHPGVYGLVVAGVLFGAGLAYKAVPKVLNHFSEVSARIEADHQRKLNDAVTLIVTGEKYIPQTAHKDAKYFIDAVDEQGNHFSIDVLRNDYDQPTVESIDALVSIGSKVTITKGIMDQYEAGTYSKDQFLRRYGFYIKVN